VCVCLKRGVPPPRRANILSFRISPHVTAYPARGQLKYEVKGTRYEGRRFVLHSYTLQEKEPRNQDTKTPIRWPPGSAAGDCYWENIVNRCFFQLSYGETQEGTWWWDVERFSCWVV